MRLIDADAFTEFLKDAIKQQKYEDTEIDGLLTVADVIEAVISELDGTSLVGFKNTPTIEPEPHWIPIKWHTITEEEREREGYPKDWVYFLDCEMPEDGQEILVTTKYVCVEKDVCYLDDGYSLDSGLDWREDIAAWKPRPEPWKGAD